MEDVDSILSRFKNGEIDSEEAKNLLVRAPYDEMGFAKLDFHRRLRSGFPEVVFCKGKADEHLCAIYKRLYEKDGEVFGTRATLRQYKLIKKVFENTPAAEAVTYDKNSRLLRVGMKTDEKKIGKVAICTAGTADIAVAEEAAQTAEYFGANVVRIYDVGVAGIHRLFDKLDDIRDAQCIVAIAGMEGALVSVVAGLVDKPVIGVPTSVGYGASMRGVSALLTMMNSCADGVAVVNIDNGFGAGYLAAQINRMGVSK